MEGRSLSQGPLKLDRIAVGDGGAQKCIFTFSSLHGDSCMTCIMQNGNRCPLSSFCSLFCVSSWLLSARNTTTTSAIQERREWKQLTGGAFHLFVCSIWHGTKSDHKEKTSSFELTMCAFFLGRTKLWQVRQLQQHCCPTSPYLKGRRIGSCKCVESQNKCFCTIVYNIIFTSSWAYTVTKPQFLQNKHM